MDFEFYLFFRSRRLLNTLVIGLFLLLCTSFLNSHLSCESRYWFLLVLHHLLWCLINNYFLFYFFFNYWLRIGFLREIWGWHERSRHHRCMLLSNLFFLLIWICRIGWFRHIAIRRWRHIVHSIGRWIRREKSWWIEVRFWICVLLLSALIMIGSWWRHFIFRWVEWKHWRHWISIG